MGDSTKTNKYSLDFSQALEVIGIVAIFLFSALILIQVFGTVIDSSNRTKKLNSAVQLCRNAAEVYMVDSSAVDAVKLLGGNTDSLEVEYGSDLKTAGENEAVYVLKFNEAEEIVERGSIHNCTISVYADNELMYSLDLAVYCRTEEVG